MPPRPPGRHCATSVIGSVARVPEADRAAAALLSLVGRHQAAGEAGHRETADLDEVAGRDAQDPAPELIEGHRAPRRSGIDANPRTQGRGMTANDLDEVVRLQR